MQKTILQVPLNKGLKENAEKVAVSQGFSSLQEIVRIFLSKLAQDKIEVNIQEVTKLSKKNERRYLNLTRDFKNGKNVAIASSVDDFMIQLNDNKVS